MWIAILEGNIFGETLTNDLKGGGCVWSVGAMHNKPGSLHELKLEVHKISIQNGTPLLQQSQLSHNYLIGGLFLHA